VASVQTISSVDVHGHPEDPIPDRLLDVLEVDLTLDQQGRNFRDHPGLILADDVDLRTVATHGYQPDLLASINRNGDSQSQKLYNVVSFRCRFSVTHGSIGDPAATLPVVVNKVNCATSYW
jgi:hypothetical protein